MWGASKRWMELLYFFGTITVFVHSKKNIMVPGNEGRNWD
jgi:hypothetical protein